MNVTRSSNVSISNYENGLSFALDQKMGRSPDDTHRNHKSLLSLEVN